MTIKRDRNKRSDSLSCVCPKRFSTEEIKDGLLVKPKSQNALLIHEQHDVLDLWRIAGVSRVKKNKKIRMNIPTFLFEFCCGLSCIKHYISGLQIADLHLLKIKRQGML